MTSIAELLGQDSAARLARARADAEQRQAAARRLNGRVQEVVTVARPASCTECGRPFPPAADQHDVPDVDRQRHPLAPAPVVFRDGMRGRTDG